MYIDHSTLGMLSWCLMPCLPVEKHLPFQVILVELCGTWQWQQLSHVELLFTLEEASYFIICVTLSRKPSVYSRHELTTDCCVVILFIHQHWYGVLADTGHLHIVIEDGVETTNQNSDSLCNYLLTFGVQSALLLSHIVLILQCCNPSIVQVAFHWFMTVLEHVVPLRHPVYRAHLHCWLHWLQAKFYVSLLLRICFSTLKTSSIALSLGTYHTLLPNRNWIILSVVCPVGVHVSTCMNRLQPTYRNVFCVCFCPRTCNCFLVINFCHVKVPKMCSQNFSYLLSYNAVISVQNLKAKYAAYKNSTLN